MSKRTQIIGCIVVLAMGVAIGVSLHTPATAQTRKPAATREVRANRFVLEDAKGRERIVMGVTNELLGIVMTSSDGKPRVTVHIKKDIATLKMYAPNPKSQAMAMVSMSSEGPVISAMGADGAAATMIASKTMGEVGIVVTDAAGDVIWMAP